MKSNQRIWRAKSGNIEKFSKLLAVVWQFRTLIKSTHRTKSMCVQYETPLQLKVLFEQMTEEKKLVIAEGQSLHLVLNQN